MFFDNEDMYTHDIYTDAHNYTHMLAYVQTRSLWHTQTRGR